MGLKLDMRFLKKISVNDVIFHKILGSYVLHPAFVKIVSLQLNLGILIANTRAASS